MFLHGLTGVAEVWGPTVARLEPRRRAIAFDQRGHGHSPRPPSGYAVADFVGDLLALCQAMDIERPHLVGHSMGGRVAMVAAAKHPRLFRSVTVVDIGPEEGAANWRTTVAAFERLPGAWPDVESALRRAAGARGGDSTDAALATEAELLAIGRARLGAAPGAGCAGWRTSKRSSKRYGSIAAGTTGASGRRSRSRRCLYAGANRGSCDGASRRRCAGGTRGRSTWRWLGLAIMCRCWPRGCWPRCWRASGRLPGGRRGSCRLGGGAGGVPGCSLPAARGHDSLAG